MILIIAGNALPVRSLSETQQWKKVKIQHIKFQAPAIKFQDQVIKFQAQTIKFQVQAIKFQAQAEIFFYVCMNNSGSNILEVF